MHAEKLKQNLVLGEHSVPVGLYQRRPIQTTH